MAKRKVGELFGKPIIQGEGDNTLTVNEILLQEEGGKISLSERVSDKVKSITNKRIVHFKLNLSSNSSPALVYASNTLLMYSCELYYQDFRYPLNISSIPDVGGYSSVIVGISDDYHTKWLENSNQYRLYYTTIEEKLEHCTEELSSEEKAIFLSCQVYRN